MSLVLVDGDHVSYGVGGLYGCGMLLCLLLVMAACPRQRYCCWWEDRDLVSLAFWGLVLVCFHDGCVVGQRRCRCWWGGQSPHVHGIGGCVVLV